MPDFRKNIYKLILSTIECLSKKGKENSMNFLVKKGLKVDFKQVGPMVRNYITKGVQLPDVNLVKTDRGFELQTVRDLSILTAYKVCNIPPFHVVSPEE